jgi:hypothetical protein
MRFVVLTTVSILLAPHLLAAQTLSPGSAHYVINYQGKAAGGADYSISAAPDGYSIAARGNAKIGTIDLAFSKNEELDSKLEILSESLNGTVNGQAIFVSVKPDGAKFDVATSANGQRLSNAIDHHPHTIFAPNFDPSAVLLFLRHAGYSADLWGLIPQQSGLLVTAKVTSQKDEKGTLKGAPIVVRHSTLVMANVTSELFSTEDGRLLQQEVPTQGFSMVRDGFILTPPKSAAPQPAPSPMPSSDAPPATN